MQQNRIIGIIGPIGSGKTTHAASIYRKSSRAVVFNAARDSAYRTHATVLLQDDIKGLRKELQEESFRIDFDTEEMQPGPRNSVIYSHLSEFLQECYYTGNLLLVLDEAHQICSPWSAPFDLLKCVRLGRHQNLDILFASQRFAGVHRELTYNAHELHLFRITEPADLDGIGERCGPNVEEAVQQLDRLDAGQAPQILIWYAGTGEYTIQKL